MDYKPDFGDPYKPPSYNDIVDTQPGNYTTRHPGFANLWPQGMTLIR